MKRFFVATCCSLMFCGSLMAQEATITAPSAPGEDVAAAVVEAQVEAAPTAAIVQEPVAVEGSVMTSTYVADPGLYQQAAPAPMYDSGAYGQVVNSGCSSCGGNVAPMTVMAPQTFTSQSYGGMGSVVSGCSSCGQSAPMMSAPMMSAPVSGCSSCGQSAPMMSAYVSGCSSCGQSAPVANCGCAPANDCGCDPCSRNRRQAVRTVSTRSRTVLTRVRGRAGSRNRCCN